MLRTTMAPTPPTPTDTAMPCFCCGMTQALPVFSQVQAIAITFSQTPTQTKRTFPKANAVELTFKDYARIQIQTSLCCLINCLIPATTATVRRVFGRPCAVRLCWWTAACGLSSKKLDRLREQSGGPSGQDRFSA